MRKNYLMYFLVIFLILVCCVVFCLGALAIGGYSVFKSFSKDFENANDNIKEICSEIAGDNFDEAYESMSNDYQKYNNVFEFKTFAETQLDGCTEMDGKDISIDKVSGSLEVDTKLEYKNDRTRRASFSFNKEGDNWMLDDIDF